VKNRIQRKKESEDGEVEGGVAGERESAVIEELLGNYEELSLSTKSELEYIVHEKLLIEQYNQS